MTSGQLGISRTRAGAEREARITLAARIYITVVVVAAIAAVLRTPRFGPTLPALLTKSGLSLKLTSMNSSCGLDVLKNCKAASLDFSILSDIDPLESKTRPTEIGASSVEKAAICWGTLSS